MSDSPTGPEVEELPDDPEVPVEDALEQSTSAVSDEHDHVAADPRRRSAISDDIEVPTADAWEQSQPAGDDDERR
jgi:hypothetical protein